MARKKIFFLITCVIIAFLAKSQPSDRLTSEDFQNRARIKERSLVLMNSVKNQVAREIQQRAQFQTTTGSNSIQGESLARLPFEIRLPADLGPLILKSLDLYIDGIYWGTRIFSKSSQFDQNIHWYQFFISEVPIGERALRLVAHVRSDPHVSITRTSVLSSQIIEGTQNIFVSPSIKKICLNVDFSFPGFNKIATLTIQSLGEDIP